MDTQLAKLDSLKSQNYVLEFLLLSDPCPTGNEESHLSQESKENAYQSSAERLSILHSRLYSEAEKIRKWKTHTEMELKQKVTLVANSIKLNTILCQMQYSLTESPFFASDSQNKHESFHGVYAFS